MVNNIVIHLLGTIATRHTGSHFIMHVKVKAFCSPFEANILLYIQHFNKNSLKKKRMQGHTEQVDSTRVFIETVGLQVSIICQS